MREDPIHTDMNWAAFEDEVMTGVIAALQEAERSHRIYQISLITDIQSLTTSIWVETLANARLHSVETPPIHGNPGDFLLPELLRFENRSLQGKLSISYSAEHYPIDAEQAIQAEVTIHLDAVVERLATSGILATLNCEPTVWIGVNSNDDWYDHVRAVHPAETHCVKRYTESG